MPISYIDQVPLIIRNVAKQKPKSILDIGCGFGKFGFLCREQIDIAQEINSYDVNKNKKYILSRKNWQTQIDAIEVYGDYICEIQRYIYNKIYLGNVVKLIDDLDSYDVILLIDVIEHFEKDEGRKLIEKLYKMTNKLLVIATPYLDFPQGVALGNDFETHQSNWRNCDFKIYKNKKIFNINNESLIVLIFKEKNQMKNSVLCGKSRVPINEKIKILIYAILRDRKAEKVINFIKKMKNFNRKGDLNEELH